MIIFTSVIDDFTKLEYKSNYQVTFQNILNIGENSLWNNIIVEIGD